MINLIICMSITVFTTKEQPLPSAGRFENPFKKIFIGLFHMPPAVLRVCTVQFFAWVGWFTYIVYITDWMGEEIYHGDPKEGSPTKYLYDEGVRQGSLALTYNAAVTMAFSAILPYLISVLGIRLVYFVGNMMLGMCLISTIFIHNYIPATVVIALCGIPWAVTMALPFTIIGQCVDATQSGLYMGTLNIFVVLPQFLVAVSVGFLISALNHNIAVGLVAGGISALIAAVFVLRIIVISPVVEIQDPSLSLLKKDPNVTSITYEQAVN